MDHAAWIELFKIGCILALPFGLMLGAIIATGEW